MIRIGNISFFRFCWKNRKLDWPKCARTGSTPVITVLRKKVRFYIIDIFLLQKKLSKLQGFIRGERNWPISCLNDLGSQEIKGDFRELKSKKFPGAAWSRIPWVPEGFFCCCLRRKLSGEAAIVTSGKKNLFFSARYDRGGQYAS